MARMARFGPQAKEFMTGGANVVFIAAEKRHGIFRPEKFLRAHPTPFPFLLDEDRSVTKAYGVYLRLNYDGINLARPATFVIAPDGIIRWIYVGASQFDRSALDQVLEQVRSASPSSSAEPTRH